MIAEAAAPDPAQYVSSYEVLRSHVIGAQANPGVASAAGQPHGVGLALLLFEGMPGWLNALEGIFRASDARTITNTTELPAAEPPSAHGSAREWLGSVPHGDLTALLTNLVLSTLLSNNPCQGRDIGHANER